NLHRLEPKLIFQKRQDRLRLGLVWRPGDLRKPPARDIRLLPLVLVFLQLLEVDERGFVVGVEFEHIRERRDGAIDETAAAIIQSKTKQDVCVLDSIQPRTLQERLMFMNRAANLALLPIQVAEH